jgi:hypothetical protein
VQDGSSGRRHHSREARVQEQQTFLFSFFLKHGTRSQHSRLISAAKTDLSTAATAAGTRSARNLVKRQARAETAQQRCSDDDQTEEIPSAGRAELVWQRKARAGQSPDSRRRAETAENQANSGGRILWQHERDQVRIPGDERRRPRTRRTRAGESRSRRRVRAADPSRAGPRSGDRSLQTGDGRGSRRPTANGGRRAIGDGGGRTNRRKRKFQIKARVAACGGCPKPGL